MRPQTLRSAVPSLLDNKVIRIAAFCVVAVAFLSLALTTSVVAPASGRANLPMPPARGIGLLHTEWGPGPRRTARVSSRREIGRRGDKEEEQSESRPRRPPAKPPGKSPQGQDGSGAPTPPSSLSFNPGVEGVDPMIAVGNQYVIITQDHKIAFFDKQGQPLTGKGGFDTSMSATDFFAGFWTPKNGDGTVNQNNINLHLGFPKNPPTKCDATADPPATPCINEFYDTRVLFDPASRRFFILSAARHPIWFNDPNTNPPVIDRSTLKVKGKYDALVRRYFAFAISKTEDPRDGFYQYMSTESNVADWPRIAVNNGSFVVAHNGPEMAKPLAYVFAVDALKNGDAAPPNFVYYDFMLGILPWENNRILVPVTHYGDSGGLTYFVRPGNPVQIFAFPKSSDPWAPSAIQKTSIQLSSAPSMLRAGAVFRANKLYLGGVTNLFPIGNFRLYVVRVTRIPIVKTKSGILAATFLPGFMEKAFGISGPGDKPGDMVNYDLPALTVNKNEDMVIVYNRSTGFGSTVLPEVRFSVFYHNESQPRPSAVLKRGDFQPKDKKGNDDTIDLATAVVDPSDDLTVWMAHEYGDKASSAYKTIIGRVRP